MRRFLILICLLFLVLPVAINLAGCSSNKSANYCNGVGYGPKRADVATVNLDPKITGISLAYGQTSQLNAPTAFSCPPAESVGVASYSYGSTNLQLVDVSPTGAVCGGRWNRTSAGGIPDYTICTPPAASTLDPKDPKFIAGGVAYLTATAPNGVPSNTVAVYVHPAISSISIPTQSSCVSQNDTLKDANGNVVLLSQGTTVIDQSGKTIPSAFVGNLTFNAVDPSIVSIDTTGRATAQNPGSTAITATLSQTSSAAGYFYTCPPASISLSYADGLKSKTVQQGAPQPLVAVVKDTKGVTLTGITLQYTSTNPTQIGVGGTGVVTASFPGSTSITAICQPTTCNSSPVNQIGAFGTGKPIASNSVQATTPGRSSTFLWVASPESQSFTPIDLTTGTTGAAIRMPYFPNSMVMNQLGSNLYFGSYRELMIYTLPSNALVKEEVSVPGVVLAVSPDGSAVVINDQVRKIIYLYNVSSGSYQSFGGVGTSAAFTADGNTLYVAGPNALYIHSAFTGWSTYDISTNEVAGNACMLGNNLNNTYVPPGAPPVRPTGTPLGTPPGYNPFCGPNVAITVPGVGAFIAGSQTIAHGFCPDTTKPSSPLYYPVAPSPGANGATTDHIAATNDGNHIIGASASTLYDIGVTITPSTPPGAPPLACPVDNSALSIPSNILLQKSLPANIFSINQVVTDPNSALAFVTYSGKYTSTPATSDTPLPYYQTASGMLASIPLTGTASAPVAGIFAPDNNLFFVGTSGDNSVHYIDISDPTKPPVDTKQVDPKLLGGDGKPVPPQFLAVRPRPTT